MLYLQHISGQGVGGESSPPWGCQLSHETCSVTDWQTRQTHDNRPAQGKNILTDKLRSTVLKKVAAQQRWGFTANDTWWIQNAVLGTKRCFTLTFDLTPRDCLDCFFMKSGLLFDFMISRNTTGGFFFNWCSITASDEPLWTMWLLSSLPYPDVTVWSNVFSPKASVAMSSFSFNLLMSQSAFAFTMLSSV